MLMSGNTTFLDPHDDGKSHHV